MQTVLLRAVPERHHALLGQLLRFGAVGVFGWVVDTAVVYLLRGSLGLYGAGLVSFLVAASANWVLHRIWTFRGHSSRDIGMHRQWAIFVAAMALGFVLNRGAYAALVTFSAVCAANPILATAAGAVAGLGLNFVTSRHWVFR